MSMILKLIFKYLKLIYKRTTAATISVIVSVFMLTVISNIFMYGFNYMKQVEITMNGSWQAKYNEVNERKQNS